MNSIFFIGADNALTEMQPSGFDTEADFQRLLADHPPLLRLAAGTSDGDLLLVKQEVGVSDVQGGSNRWSIDHLFLTRSGVPVLVEVKRASDTRARREVVAQMLDYAAHGTAYWSAEEFASQYQVTAARYGLDPEKHLLDFIGGIDPEAFWRQVEANLRSGRVRMVFVADRIGKELRRIVEFLNEQMRPAEVLAIEVAQFTNRSGVRTIVPQLVGATERAQSVKAVTPQLPSVTDVDWLASFGPAHGPEIEHTAEEIAGFLESLGLSMRVVPSQKPAAFSLVAPENGPKALFYLIREPGSGSFQFAIQTLKYFPAYASEQARAELHEELKALVPNARITTSGPNTWPMIPLAEAGQGGIWERLQGLIRKIAETAAQP